MEHIVQFAIGIDDDAIRNNIEKNAEKQIVKQLSDDIARVFFTKDFYGKTTRKPSAYVTDHIEKFLDDNREEIIEMAGKFLADKLARTKRGKEILSVIDKE